MVFHGFLCPSQWLGVEMICFEYIHSMAIETFIESQLNLPHILTYRSTALDEVHDIDRLAVSV